MTRSDRIVWTEAAIKELRDQLAEPEHDHDVESPQLTLDYPWPLSVTNYQAITGIDGDAWVHGTIAFDEVFGAEDYEIRLVPIEEPPLPQATIQPSVRWFKMWQEDSDTYRMEYHIFIDEADYKKASKYEYYAEYKLFDEAEPFIKWIDASFDVDADGEYIEGSSTVTLFTGSVEFQGVPVTLSYVSSTVTRVTNLSYAEYTVEILIDHNTLLDVEGLLWLKKGRARAFETAAQAFGPWSLEYSEGGTIGS